jgi:LemA protein
MSAFAYACIIVALALLTLVFGTMFLVYNRLTILRNRFKTAFAQIDVQMKRRYDLIPNLVKSAKAYLSHERDTLEAVVRARNVASDVLTNASSFEPSPAPDAFDRINSSVLNLEATLGRLLMVMENYPALKADHTIADLSEELRSAENRVSLARQAFNDSVMFYNQSREIFPNVLFSKMLGFKKADLWELASPSESVVPKVDL